MKPSLRAGWLAAVCSLLFLPAVFAQEPPPAAGEGGAAQYVLEDIQGGVQVLETGGTQWEDGEEGQVLEAGDEIKVGPDSEATLTLGTDTSVHLDPGTDLKVEQMTDNPQGGFLSRLGLAAGRILADVQKHLEESHSTFEVEAGGVVCGVRGTAFEVEADGEQVQALTHEGEVDVKGAGQDNLVRAGSAFSFRRGRFVARRLLDRVETARFAKWRAFRAHVFEKRRQRLEDIRRGLRRPWVRRALRRHHRQMIRERRQDR
ncbi:MAG TPA: FecR domain-containing protein [bacterium]|nr:FecR domain-containing protein [bacterium]